MPANPTPEREFTGWHMAITMIAFFGVIISVNLTMAILASSTWTGLIVKNGYVASQDRVTRLGKHLRAMSLDELPNLWNVVRGSMSLVGPRPLVPAEAELIGLDHPRFAVKPGVTGLAQVSGRDEISLDERSELDAEYAASRSLQRDLAILRRTVVTVLRRRGG